jgi:hypothetical protein
MMAQLESLWCSWSHDGTVVVMMALLECDGADGVVMALLEL